MSVLTFSVLRALSHSQFTSGQALATQFGVTRSAISAALKHADALGLEVFALTRKGYRLAEPLDWIEHANVHRALESAATRIDLEVCDSLDSTNSELLRRMATANRTLPSGMAIISEVQTAGRGRRGRVWQSGLGQSLTFSLLWRFDTGIAQLAGLSLAVGLAVTRSLAPLGIAATLKWPNDIWINEKKCGGILIETQGEVMGPVCAVIGIGLNVRFADSLLASIDQPSTDIERHLSAPASRSELLGRVLASLVAMLDQFAADGFASFREEWQRAHALHGKQVEVIDATGTKRAAKVLGVAANGALEVELDGRRTLLSAEEISLRRPSP